MANVTRRRVPGIKGAADGVDGLVEVVSRRSSAAIRPQQVHDLLPMHPVPRGQDEQLQQVRRLAQPPSALLDGAGTHRDPEPAEQLHAYRFGSPDRVTSRAFPEPSRSA